MNNLPEKPITLNLMQLLFARATQRIKTIQCGRGAGKSTIAALEMKDLIFDMPRSKNLIVTGTFQQALTRTLPSTIKALEMLGFSLNLHYFVGVHPPRSWKWQKAYEPPLDLKHSITFYNGTTFDLLSQDTNSRGGNYSAGFGDEGQDLNNDKLQAEIIPTMRGEYQRFKDRRTYRHFSLFCSMPRSRTGEYIFKYEELAQEFPNEYFYLSAPSKINSANLPPDWFKDQKRILLPSEYDIEIENIRPKKVIGGFYQMFDDSKHTYSAFNNDYYYGLLDDKNGYKPETFENMSCLQDLDLNVDEMLEISMDYGAWFNGIVTGQEDGNAYHFRFLSAMSITHGERFEDLLERWCNYYRFQKVKTVKYWYDHTARDRDARAEEYPAIVRRVLSSHGWTVIDCYIGMQPSQDDRYKFFGYIYRQDHPDLPTVTMNKHHCKYLVMSLNGAKVSQGRNGFEKDKKDEKNQKIDQRTTTHFSDAHDTLLMGKYAERTVHKGGIAAPIFSR